MFTRPELETCFQRTVNIATKVLWYICLLQLNTVKAEQLELTLMYKSLTICGKKCCISMKKSLIWMGRMVFYTIGTVHELENVSEYHENLAVV